MPRQSPASYFTQRDDRPFRDGCRLGPSPTILSHSFGALEVFSGIRKLRSFAILAIAMLDSQRSSKVEYLYSGSRLYMTADQHLLRDTRWRI